MLSPSVPAFRSPCITYRSSHLAGTVLLFSYCRIVCVRAHTLILVWLRHSLDCLGGFVIYQLCNTRKSVTTTVILLSSSYSIASISTLKSSFIHKHPYRSRISGVWGKIRHLAPRREDDPSPAVMVNNAASHQELFTRRPKFRTIYFEVLSP